MDSVARLSSQDVSPARGAIYVWLALIVVAGGALRGFHLGTQPFWIDEMYSVWFSQRTWSELWTLVPSIETHPPLYYTLLKAWVWLLGDYREWWLRALSVLASVLCIPVAYGVVTRMSVGAHRQRCGLAASAALALNPVQIAYAQDARPYALLSLSVGLTLFGLASFYATVTAPVDAGRARLAGASGADGAETRLTATLVIAGALSAALWLHNTTPILFGPPVALMAIGIVCVSRRRWHDFAWLALAGFLALLVWSPNVMWLARNVTTLRHGFWLPPPTADDITTSLKKLFGYDNAVIEPRFLRVAVNATIATVTALGIWKALKAAPHAAYAAIVLLCVPIAISVLVSWTVLPIFMTRTLIWVAFGQAAAWGWFIALGRPESLFARAGVLVAVAAIAIVAFPALIRSQHTVERWPEAVRALRADDAALVVFVPNFLEFAMRWYGASPSANQEFLPMPAPFPAMGRDAYPSGMRAEPGIDPTDVALLARHAAGKQRVWIVSRRYDVFDSRGLLYGYLQCSRGAPQTLKGLGALRVWRFGPATRDDDGAGNGCLRPEP